MNRPTPSEAVAFFARLGNAPLTQPEPVFDVADEDEIMDDLRRNVTPVVPVQPPDAFPFFDEDEGGSGGDDNGIDAEGNDVGFPY